MNRQWHGEADSDVIEARRRAKALADDEVGVNHVRSTPGLTTALVAGSLLLVCAGLGAALVVKHVWLFADGVIRLVTR